MKIWKWVKSLFKAKEVVKEKVPESDVQLPLPIDIPSESAGEAAESYLPNGVLIKSTMRGALGVVVKTIISNKQKYIDVQIKTGVPWRLIAGIHYRESSLDFRGVLHNGEKILGTGKKTKLVPSGRGPFSTWEEAAIDALLLKKAIFPKQWTAEACHEFSERFNGLGYRNKGMISPYVWAATGKYKSGLFVKDGVLDRNKVDQRLGTASIMEGLKDY